MLTVPLSTRTAATSERTGDVARATSAVALTFLSHPDSIALKDSHGAALTHAAMNQRVEGIVSVLSSCSFDGSLLQVFAALRTGGCLVGINLSQYYQLL